MRDKEDAIGRGSFGLVFVANKNSEKVVIKKLLSENDQEKRLFIKEAKMFHGVKSEHIVKFKAVCISNIILNLFFWGGGEGTQFSADPLLSNVSLLERFCFTVSLFTCLDLDLG